MAASGDGELAGDRRKDGLYLLPEPEEDRDGDDRNKGKNQGVFDESLASPIFISA